MLAACPWHWSEHTACAHGRRHGRRGHCRPPASRWGGAWSLLRARVTRSALSMSFDLATDMAEAFVLFSQGSRPYRAIYVRLPIGNRRRRRAAEGVEAIVAEVAPIQQAEGFMPEGWRTEVTRNLGTLGWTHVQPPELRLGPGVMRTVDLG
jgi:hypothetical protein